MREVKAVCPRDCYDTCFLLVLVEKGKIISIRGSFDNPVTQGFICPRGVKDHERIYSKDRILNPYMRTGEKPSREFVRISWDEALDIVAEKIREVICNYGSQSILHLEYAGNSGLITQSFSQRIWYAIGATRTDYSICSKSGHEAISLHYGLSYGIQPEELLNMKLIVFWGFNARVSSPHLWRLALKAKGRKATIAVIDPRESESARDADIWLKPKPGSDVALAYGIARYLISHNYVDLKFIRKWTYGYDKFKEEAMKWTPSKIEEITGVRWRSIERLGEAYAKKKPSATMIGLGLQKSIYGAEAVRAISLIPALIGLHRGFYYTNSQGWLINNSYLTGESLTDKKIRTVSQVALSKLVERGEFKFIYIYSMNPAATLPNQKAFRNGLTRNDVFVVVCDTHWTETTNYADIVLPAPTYLEKEDIVISYSHGYVRISRKAVEPLGESRDEVWIMRELAKRLKLKEKWIYEKPWNAIKKALQGAFQRGSFKDLMADETLKLKSKPKNKYQTPTGKIEFYSKKAEEYGLNPLPKQMQIDLNENEFILLSSSLPYYTHTQFQDVYGPIPKIVWISSEDAKKNGIKNGDTIELYNDLGSVMVKAVVTDKIPSGVLWSPKMLTGLNGNPLNILTPSTTQRIGGGPIFNSTKVRINKRMES